MTLSPIERTGDPRGEAGRLAYLIKRVFRDLARIEGFEDARATVAEIINSEADRRKS